MKNSSKKKLSLFYLLITLVTTCVIIVIYISSSIQINKLAVGNNLLREEIRRKTQANDMLLTEVEKLTSFDRISNIAENKFALKYKEASISTDKKVVLKKSEVSKERF
jgi:cell division protein FtsL